MYSESTDKSGVKIYEASVTFTRVNHSHVGYYHCSKHNRTEYKLLHGDFKSLAQKRLTTSFYLFVNGNLCI